MLWMRVMALRQEVAGPYIYEETGEKSEQKSKRRLRDGKKHRDKYSRHRCGRIEEEPLHGKLAISPILYDHAHGIYAVRKIVRKHGCGNDKAHLRRDLKSESDADAVKKTVERKRSRAPSTTTSMPVLVRFILVVTVKDKEPVHEQIQCETKGHNSRHEGRIIFTTDKLQCLGYEVEERGPDDRPGAETQDEVEAVLQMERKKTAQEGRDASSRTYKDDHGRRRYIYLTFDAI